MKPADLIGLIASITPVTDADHPRDVKDTINRLIEEARAIVTDEKLRAWLTRAVALLAKNQSAWDDEEDSVKEEKAELISELEHFFEELAADNPLEPKP